MTVLAVVILATLHPSVSAQSESTTSPDQRIVSFGKRGSDGTEVIEQQVLKKDEAVLATRINGKVVSKYVVEADGAQRVIITFKDAPIAQSYKKNLFSAAAQTARQKTESARANFRSRLLSLENQHRGLKGITAASTQSMILREYNYCLSGMAARVQPDAIEEIRKMPEVEGVYIDQQSQKLDTGYGIAQIGAPHVWQQFGITGAGIRIAIIDTGIDYLHPDLGGGFGPGHKVVGGYDFVNSDQDPIDDNGHGTHVAGIAAANGVIKGVAPDANLLAVKVLDGFGFGFDSNIIAGIEWAVTNGANIINMSLGDIFGGGDPDDPLCQAVDAATQAGVLVVCAAGNAGAYNTVGSPAAARTAVAVGADDMNHHIAPFSSRGAAPKTLQIKPEVVAPGVGILSTVPQSGTQLSDPSGYMTLDGTSMASPHAAGAAALLLQKNPQWTPQQLKLALMESALNLLADVMTQGSGEIDVYASASSPVLSTGGDLSFGWDDLTQNIFTSIQPLNLTNTTSTAIDLAMSTQFNAPPGMQVTVEPSSVSLAPGATATVNFTMRIDNATTPNLPAAPFAYGGMVQFTSATGVNLHRPFAICKAPKLIISADDIIQNVTIFHGSDLPRFNTLFTRGPLEMLIPQGSYDFFIQFLSTAPFPHLELRDVVREKVNITTLTNLAISTTEAKNQLEIKPIDIQGAPLSPNWTVAQYTFYNVAAKTFSVNSLAGFSISDSAKIFVSDVTPAFTFDASLAGLANAPQDPSYFFYGTAHDGITSSRDFTFKPSDFNKTTILHKPRPNGVQADLRNWLWSIALGASSSGSGYESGVVLNGSVEQTIYSIPSTTTTAQGGFWSVDEVSKTNTGNLPFLLSDQSIIKTAPFRPLSKNILAEYDIISGAEIFRATAKRLLMGQGPAHWSASMQNLSDKIRIKTAPRSQVGQKFFDGQLEEELVHGLLSYTLTPQGQPSTSGTLDGTMDFIIGQIKEFPVEMAVTPGIYDLTIPFDEFFMHDKPGHLEVVNHFDTTKADPNPPFLTHYQLVNPFDILQLSPFLDAVPLTGANLIVGVGDDVKVNNVTMSFGQGTSWIPLPVFKLSDGRYAAYIPWLGFDRDATKVKTVVTDSSGNALTVTETIPNTKK